MQKGAPMAADEWLKSFQLPIVFMRAPPQRSTKSCNLIVIHHLSGSGCSRMMKLNFREYKSRRIKCANMMAKSFGELVDVDEFIVRWSFAVCSSRVCVVLNRKNNLRNLQTPHYLWINHPVTLLRVNRNALQQTQKPSYNSITFTSLNFIFSRS